MKRILPTLLMIFLASAACSSDSPTETGGNNNGGNNGGNNNGGNTNPNTVTIAGTSFSPSTLTVAAGTTVTWNAQNTGHTITPQGHTQWSRVDVSSTGTVLEVTFATPGTYNYFCEPHSGMTGRIVVQ
jgi:plastocyanin